MGRLAISPLHRALVLAALTANGLVALAALADEAEMLVFIAAFAAMPAALLWLEPHPRAFRFTAASLALAHATLAVVLVPAAVLLGGAAVLPTARLHRYAWAALWCAAAVLLVLTTLLLIARM